jgi:hypothetical protein
MSLAIRYGSHHEITWGVWRGKDILLLDCLRSILGLESTFSHSWYSFFSPIPPYKRLVWMGSYYLFTSILYLFSFIWKQAYNNALFLNTDSWWRWLKPGHHRYIGTTRYIKALENEPTVSNIWCMPFQAFGSLATYCQNWMGLPKSAVLRYTGTG